MMSPAAGRLNQRDDSDGAQPAGFPQTSRPNPHVANPDSAAVIRSIADNGLWVAIHLAIIVAVLMMTGGLV